MLALVAFSLSGDAEVRARKSGTRLNLGRRGKKPSCGMKGLRPKGTKGREGDGREYGWRKERKCDLIVQ